MRFYTQQHCQYCGVDLHARSMYLYIFNAAGEIVLHRNIGAAPQPFLEAIASAPRRPRRRRGTPKSFRFIASMERLTVVLLSAMPISRDPTSSILNAVI